jgi:hypothetical protein
MRDRFIVVSFFTKEYCDEALRLVSSLEEFDIDHDITGISSRGSWIANVNYKAEFCRDKLVQYKKPIVWIDCDAEVKSYPVLFPELKDFFDIGLFYRNRENRPHELLSGTLYFNNTSTAMRILDLWVSMCRANSTSWDQRNLNRVIEEYGDSVKIFEFPSSYVRIFDAEDMLWDGDPVILHHQASRRLKRIVT